MAEIKTAKLEVEQDLQDSISNTQQTERECKAMLAKLSLGANRSLGA